MQPTPPATGGTDPQYGFAGCYRHPDRLTGVRCVRCDRPICPECQRPASVGFQCPDDVEAGSRSIRRPRTQLGALIATGTPLVTYALITINVLTYIATSISKGGSFTSSQGRLFADWVMQPDAVESGHQYYRLLTGAFLHVSPTHLILNMVTLYMVGIGLEPVMGRVRYLSVYLLAAFGGSAAVLLLGSRYGAEAGASGAIYGLFATALVLSRILGVFEFRPILITVVVNFVLTFSLAGISKLGHMGGFVIGGLATLALLGWTVSARRPKPWTERARSPQGQSVSLLGILAVMVLACVVRVG